MMKTNYVKMHKTLEERLAQLGGEISGPMTGFVRLNKKAVEEGALSSKVKEMMALAISIVVGCEGCIAYHVHDAVAAGATRQELLETIDPGHPNGRRPGVNLYRTCSGCHGGAVFTRRRKTTLTFLYFHLSNG